MTLASLNGGQQVAVVSHMYNENQLNVLKNFPIPDSFDRKPKFHV